RETELRDVVLVDLVERAEALRAVRAPIHQPVARVFVRIAQALRGNESLVRYRGPGLGRRRRSRRILALGAAADEQRERDARRASAQPEAGTIRQARADLHDDPFLPVR